MRDTTRSLKSWPKTMEVTSIRARLDHVGRQNRSYHEAGCRCSQHELISFESGAILHRLLLAGRRECLDYRTEKLESEEAQGNSSGEWNGMPVERDLVLGDWAADVVTEWRADNVSYERLAPDQAEASCNLGGKSCVTIDSVTNAPSGSGLPSSRRTRSIRSTR